MKIMFVTSTLTSGGSERVISLIANDLVTKGYDVEIICLQEPIVFYSLHKKVKRRFAENEAGKFIVAKMKWLRRRIIEEKPDVVIAFMILVYLTTLFSLVGSSFKKAVSMTVSQPPIKVPECVLIPVYSSDESS